LGFLKKLWARPWCRFVLAAIVIVGLLPLLFSVLHIATVQRIWWLFILLNSLFAFLGGIYLQHTRASGWWILVPAAIFALLVLWRYADYNYWFCAIYLCLGFWGLGWGQTSKQVS
jgi:hypothetical membrane protein